MEIINEEYARKAPKVRFDNFAKTKLKKDKMYQGKSRHSLRDALSAAIWKNKKLKK